MEKLVTYERKADGYGELILNRPNKRNAISIEMCHQLKNCIIQAKDADVKFLVITGAGDRMFSAGGDLKDLHGGLSTEEAFSRLKPMKEVLELLISFPVPVIGLLNGDALGGGCEIATACDVRIAKVGTKFGFVQSNIGILPGWGGGAILYKKVQPSFAFDWLMHGNVYHAAELKEKGWLHQIADKEEWTNREELLRGYIKKSTKQMRLLKDQFKTNIQAEELPKLMLEEVKNCASLWETPEHIAAVQTFWERNN